MSIHKLPSGRWGAQVYDPSTKSNVRVSKILGRNYVAPSGAVGSASFRLKSDAKAAREEARARVSTPRSAVTVAEFCKRWLSDPLFARPKASTMVINGQRTKAFVKRFGTVPLADVGKDIVREWLEGGKRNHTVPALRAMWNDAASAKAGCLVATNPWANLGLETSTGNRHKHPPTEAEVWALIAEARRRSGPYMAAWLQVAAFTGMRPGELDILRWDNVDFKSGRIRVVEQFSGATSAVTLPKNGRVRDAILTPPARDALVALPRQSEHVFVNLRGNHFTKSTRVYHWNAIRAGADWDGSLYLATRHFAGWYMVNVLELDSEDVAFALGHEDGGDLVRKLYGHRNRARALDRVQAAFESTGNVRPLRAVASGENT